MRRTLRVGDDAPWRAFRRFCNEWTGCARWRRSGWGRRLTGDAGVAYVLEDPGAGETLADKLIMTIPGRLAWRAAHAHTLGELHAATQGQGRTGTAAARARRNDFPKRTLANEGQVFAGPVSVTGRPNRL
jgi:hypothetical protein